LNQPRLSLRTSRRTTSRPAMGVWLTASSAIDYWPWRAYLSSISAFCGRHHASFA
jgi:hypothetical protein